MKRLYFQGKSFFASGFASGNPAIPWENPKDGKKPAVLTTAGFWCLSKKLLLQQVADLCKEFFLVGGSGRSGGSGFFFLLAQFAELVHALDHHEDDEGQDQEADDGGDEVTDVQIVVNDLACLVDLLAEEGGQLDLPGGEVDATGEDVNDRHDDVVGEGGNQILKYATDEDADGHVEHVALHCKFLKFFQKAGLFFFLCHDFIFLSV